ncbi:response regulator [Cohnella herbarum]|uniref:Response regulator n=1 Tax=Cohnella herbarum TaxID=2728023 RepID=A0A7Z2ZKL0_9BACL|nr:response regulator [Cohnella herbarum]QJD82222.1 response regulator [Cohnella herbarum]
MYKLLIVDDEALVREAIIEKMDWEQLGFVCIGDCEDGLEALKFIERETPDVVLTDIGMPFMNGLELTSELAKRYPDVKVIILTGYDDFDFAQQALKLQAVDYILKPITASELEAIIRKLAQELDLERRQVQDYEQLKRQLTANLPLLKERFLERLVTARMTEKQIETSSEYFHIQWNGSLLTELVIDVDEFEWTLPSTLSDQELIRFAVYNIAQEITSKYEGTEIFRDRENRVIVLVSGNTDDELQELTMQAAEEIHLAVTSYLPIKISIGIGRSCTVKDDVSLVHQSALSALDYRYVIGANEIIRITDMEQRERPELLSVVAWDGELITKLKTGTPQEMDDWIRKLFTTFREHVYPIDICYIYLQRILLTMMHTLYEVNSQATSVFGEGVNPVTDINRMTNLDEMEVWMRDLCGNAVSMIRSTREDQSANQIAKAMEYVKINYTDPELSLKSVAQHVALSSSYFSSMFKTYNGRSFVEFVTHIRMEKAKELLSLSAMKSYEIAYAVGYSDPHYFSGTFKKHTGDTPTEYRNKLTTGKA